MKLGNWINGSKESTDKLKQIRLTALIFILFIFLGLGMMLDIFVAQRLGYLGGSKEKDINVAIIEMNEPITGEYANRLIQRLETIKKSENYKTILLKFACPGGSPSASHDIASYINDLKKEIDVVFYVSEMAASGGYYIACVADEIIASPSSVVGSIGVIMPIYDAKSLSKRLGINEQTITAGSKKQPYSLITPPSQETKAYLSDNILTPIYNNFLKFVSEHRHMSLDRVKGFAEGEVFISSEVVGSLVDKLSTIHQVKNSIKKNLLKKFPQQEIGFIPATPKKLVSNPFGIEVNIKLDKTLLNVLGNIKTPQANI